ncbi:hypothetical protein CEXT_384811 [Caerostris extrusa]|uniref:C2H2-type domain-containing protein n=1 Tax=Caerostris extrusa TaxID=172846 RepID=A0AAV4RVN2_CAEEX|nr:hypothetical protein CEXT_384811 [Caerostris extrusa]
MHKGQNYGSRTQCLEGWFLLGINTFYQLFCVQFFIGNDSYGECLWPFCGLDSVQSFKCPVCSREFSRRGNLVRHQLSLHAEVQVMYSLQSVPQDILAQGQHEGPRSEALSGL